MSRSLSLNFELRDALAVSRNLGLLSNRLPSVQKRAGQTLRRRLPVEARRDIQREYNVGARRINQDLSISGDSETSLRLIGRFRGIGLTNFGARQTRKGVTAAILRGRRNLHPGAFLATLLSGNVQAVSRGKTKRVMTQGRYKGKRRQPLLVEYGATVAQMLAKGRRPERLADYARGVLQAEVQRLLRVYDPDGSYLNSLNSEASS